MDDNILDERAVHYVIYRSTAVDGITPSQVDEILDTSRAFNFRENLSGVLLYDESQFLQFLQGPLIPLTRAYSRIKAASQHLSIIEISRGPSKNTYFENWDMGFCKTTQSELQRIANACWKRSEPELRKHIEESEGVALLLDFWDSYHQQKKKN